MEQTQKYLAIVGNEQSEKIAIVGVYASEDAAERAAKQAVRARGGWYRVRRMLIPAGDLAICV